MGQILLGLIIAIAGVIYALYTYKKSKNDMLEMQYMKTTPISEAVEICRSMEDAGNTYRHYVELKGMLHSKEPVMAPFTERQVAYYHSRSYSVHEETRTEHDSKGNARTHTVKKENLISDEKSPVPIYITDQSSDIAVYIDIDSFGSDADIQPGCDRFEPQDSHWVQRNSGHYGSNIHPFSGARFLGYRLKEEILNLNQPVYILGELYRNGDCFYVSKSLAEKKASKFSYKSEEQLVDDTKNKSVMSLVIGIGAVVIGIFVAVSNFVR